MGIVKLLALNPEWVIRCSYIIEHFQARTNLDNIYDLNPNRVWKKILIPIAPRAGLNPITRPNMNNWPKSRPHLVSRPD